MAVSSPPTGTCCRVVLLIALLALVPIAAGPATSAGQVAAQSPSVTIQQERPGNVFYTTQRPRVTVETGAGNLGWTITDYNGRIVEGDSTSVNGGSTTIETTSSPG
jgi:hypothetical protein